MYRNFHRTPVSSCWKKVIICSSLTPMVLDPKDSEGGQFAYPKLQVMKFLEVIFVLQSPRFADCCQKNYWTKVPTTCLHDITLYCTISHHIDISLQYITVYYFTLHYILSHYMTLYYIVALFLTL